MKRTFLLLICVSLLTCAGLNAQTAKNAAPARAQKPATVAQATKPATPAPKAAPAAGDLASVLKAMDTASVKIKTVEAKFVWDQYSKVVDEHDLQKGTIYFRRSPKDTEMMADIAEPSARYVQYAGGKVRVYEPHADQGTEYNTSKNKADVESYLVLGFGGSGRDLQKSFDVKYAGTENVGGINTAKLELTPKSQKIHNMFSQIVLWIDPARGISVQQKFIEGPPDRPSGDYRLAKYSDIKIDQPIPADTFKLKTTSNTKWTRQG